MKVWKGLFFVTLLLCATLFVVGVSAADDGTHTHPICGATHKEIGDHTGACEAVEWTAWDGTSEIDYGASNTAYVYLSDNATRKSLTVTGGTLYLCLNGKTLTGSITVKGDATLNICDCKGGGEIKKTSACAVEVRTVNSSNVHTTLNLYGGKISSNSISSYDNGSIVLYNNDGNNAQTVAVFNMYGGEVYNGDSGSSAVYVSPANIYTSYYEINMHGGSIRCEKDNGFALNDNENVTMQIAGGTITSGRYGVDLGPDNKLTLSRNPQFIDKAYYNGTAEIDIPANVILTVTDDFSPAGGTTISVRKSVDATGSVVFAMSASGSSLSDKAQYFVSAKEGYFVECDTDGNLRLTACAITEQPTKDNSYTVSANGNPKYQWWSTKRGDVSVTSERATVGEFHYNDWREEWSYGASGVSSVTLEVFTLYMAAGDVLTLNEFYDNYRNFSITDVVFTRSGGSSTSVTGTGDTYTFTALEDGEYTLKITTEAYPWSDSYDMDFTFTATVTGDVVDAALSDQTDKTLNPETLGDGKYMCVVTWDDETTLYTNVVEFHKHTWNDGEVTTEPTCTTAGEKTFICTTCNETKTETLDALGHDFTGGTWQSDADEHWKKCSRCDVTDTRSAHKWDNGKVTTNPTCLATGVRTFTCTECSAAKEEAEPALGHDLIHHEAKAATCTEKGWDAYDTCSRCDHTTYKENPVLGHDFEGGKWQSDANQHWKKCSRCEETNTKSAHDWNEGEVTTKPTCTVAGVRTFTCAVCSATKEEAEPALGHDLIHHDAKAATCTEKGWTAYDTCSRCDHTTYRENPVLGHDFEGGEWKHDESQHWKKCSRCEATTAKSTHAWNDGEETKAPTCTETGVKTFTCTKCSATKEETLDALGHDFEGGEWKHDENQHWKKCSRCEATTAKSTHAWNDGKVTTAPTCTATGVKTFTCTVCSETKTQTLDALGHDFEGGEWKHDESQHWKKCSRCEATTAKSAHDWNDGKVTTDPTCTETGVKIFTCTECSATKEETLDALGHDLKHHEAKAATCTETGWDAYDTCSRCDHTTYKESPALGHDFKGGEWKSDENHHWKQCSRCEETDTKSAHEWNDGEVTTAPTCTTTGVKTFTCTECSATEEETLDALGHELTHHDAKAATCTEKGWDAYNTCSRCDYTTYEEKDVLGHDFTADTWEHDANNHWKKCSRCDAIDAKAGHTGGTATCKDSAVCTVCSEAYGARNPRNHVGGTEIRGMAEATTKKEGHTGDSYCKGCDAKLSDGTVIPVISDLSTDKKSDLRSAVEEMEKALSDRSDVYTEEQKELLTDSINATKAALKSIENAEEAVKRADAMPAADKIRPDDEAAIGAYEAAKKAYDDLSADEKRMAGERTKEALDAMLKALTDYDITNGNGSTWTADDKNDGLTFTVNGYHKKFAGVVINGTVIDPKYYDIKVGSTVVTLKPEYLETLSAGEYTLLVQYTDGSTDGKDTFTITKAAAADPDVPTALKGEDYALLVMACGVALLLIGIAVLIRYFDKRREER